MTHKEFADKYLSGEIKGRFLRNIVIQKGPGELNREKNFNDPKDIAEHIWCAFTWAGTEQGHKYWMDVVRSLEYNPLYYNTATKEAPTAPKKRSWEVWGVYDKCEHRDAQVPMIVCQTRSSARGKRVRVSPVNGKYCEGVRKYIVTEA